MDRVLQLCYTSLITHADILSHLLLKPLSRSSNEQNASQAAAMTHNFYKEFVSPELLLGQVLLENQHVTQRWCQDTVFGATVRALVAVYCFLFSSSLRVDKPKLCYQLCSQLDVKSICRLWTWPVAQTHTYTQHQKLCARSPYQHRSGSAKPLYWMADFQT